MKKYLLSLCLSLPVFCWSQAPNIEWQQTYGGTGPENASLVSPTFDGGYIMAGFSGSTDGDITGNIGGVDYWIVKTDALGNLQWQKSYGGTASDQAYYIQQTADNGYVLIGSTNSNNIDVTGFHGALDYWVLKLDNAGNFEWQKSLGGSSTEIGFQIIQTLDGGYALTGLSNTTNGSGDLSDTVYGGQDYWFCKLDVNGNLQWEENYGGNGTEQSFGLVQNADSSYVICGFSGSPNTGLVTGNNGSNDYWIVKIDPAGNLIWQKSYGGSLSDRCFNIAKTSDGGYILNGTTASTDSNVTNYHGGIFDYWVVKIDSMGTLQWQRTLGGSGEDFGRSVEETMDGGYLVAGRSESLDGDVTGNHGLFDYWLVKLDATGTNIEWQQSYGGSANESAPPSLNVFMNATQLPDGKFIMGGYTYSTDGDAIGNTSSSASDGNYWLVKLDACPAYSNFADSICSGDSYLFNSMLLTTSGAYQDTLLSAGGCDSVVTLNLHVNTILTSPIQFDSICNGNSYLFNSMQLTTSGTYYDTLSTVAGCDSIITLQLFVAPAINPVITPVGNDLFTGTYASYQWLFNGSPIGGAIGPNYTVTGGGLYSVIVINTDGCIDTSAAYTSTLGLNDLLLENVSIYPNPAHNELKIALPYTMDEVNIVLYSSDGKIMQTETQYATSNMQLFIDKLSPGIYLLKITGSNGNYIFKKIIKE